MLFMRAAMLAALSLVAMSLFASQAFSHCFVGARFFPATLVTDDPCVADELSLPTISAFGTGDNPSAAQVNLSSELSKRITNTLGVSIGAAWSQITPQGMPSVTGFQNLETTIKWQLATIPQHEFVMSAGFAIEWGGTGEPAVGADPFNTYAPTIWFGNGFGDLPDSVKWLRPFAITGQIAYAIPGALATYATDPDTGDVTPTYLPQVLQWGGTLQYSMPYLASNVVDLGLPRFFNRLNFIVEASLQTPVANTLNSGGLTTGTINPGIIWTGDFFQFGVEAIVPVNSQSGSNVGIIAQFHIYLDDLFPNSIGKPIFGGPTTPGRRTMGYY
jgi:hypothetical protein